MDLMGKFQLDKSKHKEGKQNSSRSRKTYLSLERPNIRLVDSGPIDQDANFGCNIEEHWYGHVFPEKEYKKAGEHIDW